MRHRLGLEILLILAQKQNQCLAHALLSESYNSTKTSVLTSFLFPVPFHRSHAIHQYHIGQSAKLLTVTHITQHFFCQMGPSQMLFYHHSTLCLSKGSACVRVNLFSFTRVRRHGYLTESFWACVLDAIISKWFICNHNLINHNLEHRYLSFKPNLHLYCFSI